MPQGNDSPDFEFDVPFMRVLINLAALGIGVGLVVLIVATVIAGTD